MCIHAINLHEHAHDAYVFEFSARSHTDKINVAFVWKYFDERNNGQCTTTAWPYRCTACFCLIRYTIKTTTTTTSWWRFSSVWNWKIEQNVNTQRTLLRFSMWILSVNVSSDTNWKFTCESAFLSVGGYIVICSVLLCTRGCRCRREALYVCVYVGVHGWAMSTLYSFIIEFLINGSKLFFIQNSRW